MVAEGRRSTRRSSCSVASGTSPRPSLIVREAGGVFRDAWGGERLDTATGVFTNAGADRRCAGQACRRAPARCPDRAQLAKTVSTPIGTPEEQAVDGWRAFGIRRLASMSARQRIVEAPSPILAIVDERARHLEQPLLGVTTDGAVRTGPALARRPQGRHQTDRRCRQCVPAGAHSRPTRTGDRFRWTPRNGGCGSTST